MAVKILKILTEGWAFFCQDLIKQRKYFKSSHCFLNLELQCYEIRMCNCETIIRQDANLFAPKTWFVQYEKIVLKLGRIVLKMVR